MDTKTDATLAKALKPPFEMAVSAKVRVRYGFADAHVELEAKLPIGKFTKSFTEAEFRLGKDAFDKGRMWADVPEFQRKRDAPPEPWTIALSEKVRVRYGFADAHAELEVLLPFKKEYRHSFDEAEIRLAQGAFQKAASWADLPEAERRRLCAAA